MNPIAVHLSAPQAQKSFDTLTRILSTAKGEERKTIQGLLDKLAPELSDYRSQQAIEQREAAAASAVDAVVAPIVATLPEIKKRGLSPSTMAYAAQIEQSFRRAEKRLEDAQRAKASKLPAKKRHTVDLTVEEMHKAALNDLTRRLTKATVAFLSSKDKPLAASKDYDLVDKRETLARQCLATGLRQGARAKTWDTVEMAGVAFADMHSHFKLGVAILGGDIKKIDQAGNMDTVCREELTEAVWKFAMDGGAERLVRTTKPARMKR